MPLLEVGHGRKCLWADDNRLHRGFCKAFSMAFAPPG